MYCKKCGKQIEEKFNNCPFCGEAITKRIDPKKNSTGIMVESAYNRNVTSNVNGMINTEYIMSSVDGTKVPEAHTYEPYGAINNIEKNKLILKNRKKISPAIFALVISIIACFVIGGSLSMPVCVDNKYTGNSEYCYYSSDDNNVRNYLTDSANDSTNSMLETDLCLLFVFIILIALSKSGMMMLICGSAQVVFTYLCCSSVYRMCQVLTDPGRQLFSLTQNMSFEAPFYWIVVSAILMTLSVIIILINGVFNLFSSKSIVYTVER